MLASTAGISAVLAATTLPEGKRHSSARRANAGAHTRNKKGRNVGSIGMSARHRSVCGTCSILVSAFDGTLLPSAAELAACKEPGNAFSIFLT